MSVLQRGDMQQFHFIPMHLMIGWEFECCVHRSAERDIRALFARLMRGSEWGNDSSIEAPGGDNGALPDDDYMLVEIRTPVYELDDGLRRLEELFVELYPYSRSKLFVTNDSCGWHNNVSCVEVHSDVTSPAPSERLREQFYNCVVQNFDRGASMEMYGRTDNRFCNNPPARHQKYCAVGYHHNRIEFRGPGGTNYERKTLTCQKHMDMVVEAFTLAYRQVMAPQKIPQPLAA